MSSSMETIGHKLQSLEERLQAANESRMVYNPSMPAPTPGLPPAMNLPGGAPAGSMRQQQRLPTWENRKKIEGFYLPVHSTPAEETDTDKKLKAIMKQTGILTVNGKQYVTDIQELKHLGDLGNGTSGNVVKMCHVQSGTIIAVKQMRRTGNPEENKRILMDLDVVLKSHDCPYIVQCLGCFVRDPDVWICMELMSMCFDKLLKLSKKPVPEHILGKVTVATVKALSYLKDQHNVIHRDVKPSNILIDERGNIKLCDFGISGRLVDSKANTRSAGCAAYMAPERIDPKKPKYDIRADVWSLGITLVELATGKSPYAGCNNDFEVLTKVLDSEPPCLPKGGDFSPEFRDFVTKCLTKNHQQRPKYQELLEQPFLQHYNHVNVDVPKWFRTIVESSGVQSIMPANLDAITVAKMNKSDLAMTRGTTIPAASAAAATTINIRTATQIPSYHALPRTNHHQTQPLHLQYQPQRTNLNHYKNDDFKQPTALPQPTVNYYKANCLQAEALEQEASSKLHRLAAPDSDYCSPASSTSSPLSPPGSAYKSVNKDDAHIVSAMNKLYGKSPYMQKKYNNGGPSAYKYISESPKKESMFSSIGQSIIRNLTTSPFSQKKHPLPQASQIDPLWRVPPPQDMGLGYDSIDVAKTQLGTSPLMGPKRFHSTNVEAKLAVCTQQPSLIPINKHEPNPHQVQGNQSPIVLQRFYHQQNQLKEKEIFKQQHQFSKHAPESQNSNPFHYNYLSTKTLPYNYYQQPPAQHSHIPISTHTCGTSSSHSTSSQSSTQSSSSQIMHYDQQHLPETLTTTTTADLSSTSALQYQQLPLQYVSLQNSNYQHAISPPSAIERTPYGNVDDGSSKLDKVFARRQQLTSLGGSSSSNSSAIDNATNNASKENSFKEEHGAPGSANSSSPSSGKSPAAPSYYRATTACSTSSRTSPTEMPRSSYDSDEPPMAHDFSGQRSSSFLRRYAATGGGLHGSPVNAHVLASMDRRHRSPDPPPRYNRGQSPLLIRKNLLELSGQPPGSPLLNRRYVSASPPLPPPRRGSESVPSSPQHFRTRIHYTPEPHRRIYRTIDQ